MSLRVEFHPLASVEITDIERWYDQRRSGLGDRFLDAIRAAIDQAAQWPNAGTPVVATDDGTIQIRKVAATGFPYAVGYEINSDALTVLAVFHQRRRPNYWTARER